MKLSEIKDLLKCEVLAGADALETDIDTAVASDAMSVVLASPYPRALLITGLTNIQSVRTAQISFISSILYVRGTRPNDTTVQLARDNKMVLLATDTGMFNSCGLLHNRGIKGVI